VGADDGLVVGLSVVGVVVGEFVAIVGALVGEVGAGVGEVVG